MRSKNNLPEVFVFEGLCNRVNTLATALMKWPDGFRLRWIVNKHCPLTFEEIFDVSKFPEVSVTYDPGKWKEGDYIIDDRELCYFFLNTSQPRHVTYETYSRIYDAVLHPRMDTPANIEQSVGVQLRTKIEYHQRANVPQTVELVDWLCRRTGAFEIILSSDDQERGEKMTARLERLGYSVHPLLSDLKGDFDRTNENMKFFIRSWLLFSLCPYGVTNVVLSSIMDMSRAFGNEVWTIGDITKRMTLGCSLFDTYGFDRMVFEPEAE